MRRQVRVRARIACALSLLSLSCALEALFKRWPQLALAVQPESIRWRRRPGLRAIEKLPVAVHAH